MHNDRIHSHRFHQYDIACKSIFQLIVNHGVATILDDDSLTIETLYIRQGLDQDLCNCCSIF